MTFPVTLPSISCLGVVRSLSGCKNCGFRDAIDLQVGKGQPFVAESTRTATQENVNVFSAAQVGGKDEIWLQ